MTFREPLLVAALWSGIFLVIGCTPSSDEPGATPGATSKALPTPKDDNPSVAASPWFQEAAVASGLVFTHQTGTDPSTLLFLPEIVCGGVALLDYDNDGDLDVYLVQGGRIGRAADQQPPNQLFRNVGNGKFEDVTATSGAGARGYGMGCAANDVDGDGNVDLYITNVGPNVLLMNNGDGTFRDASGSSGLAEPGFGASAAFFDFDQDSDLDLVLTNYVGWAAESEISCTSVQGIRDYCQPNNYRAPAPDKLFRNDGGTFTDISAAAGLNQAFGHGLGVVVNDFDDDGRLDFFVANDGNKNQHWFQVAPGRFEDRSLMGGTAVNYAGKTEAGMGVATLDVNGDGRWDLFLSHLRNESNTLYLNRGGYYDDASDEYGLGASSVPFTGFGLGFADFDLDGDEDIFVANGHVMQTAQSRAQEDPYAQPNLIYEHDDQGKFRERLPRGGTNPTVSLTSRGAAFGDLDNDGDVDIVVVNRDGPVSLLINQAAGGSSKHHWIGFDLREKNGALAMHARVQITAAGRKQSRMVNPHYSYLSSNDPRVHFGLGASEAAEQIVIRWADGTTETTGPLPADQIHRIQRSE